MKITFEEITSKKEYLHQELLESLTPELIEQAANDGFFEVKILVNGVELEPKFLIDLVENMEKYMEETTERLFVKKFYQPAKKAKVLSAVIDEVIDKVMSEFNIDKEKYV